MPDNTEEVLDNRFVIDYAPSYRNLTYYDGPKFMYNVAITELTYGYDDMTDEVVLVVKGKRK